MRRSRGARLREPNAIHAPIKPPAIGRMRQHGRSARRTLIRSLSATATAAAAALAARQIPAHAAPLDSIETRRRRALTLRAPAEIALEESRAIVPVRQIHVHTARADRHRWIPAAAAATAAVIVGAIRPSGLLTQSSASVEQLIAGALRQRTPAEIATEERPTVAHVRQIDATERRAMRADGASARNATLLLGVEFTAVGTMID